MPCSIESVFCGATLKEALKIGGVLRDDDRNMIFFAELCSGVSGGHGDMCVQNVRLAVLLYIGFVELFNGAAVSAELCICAEFGDV